MGAAESEIVADVINKRLYRVSTSTGKVLQTIALTDTPQSLALSADQARLFVGTVAKGIRIYNTTTWAEVGNIALPDVEAISWWSGGNVLAVASDAGVSLIEPVTGATTALIQVSPGLRALTINETEGLAYATD